MLCKLKLNGCCCWRWSSSKSEDLSDDDRKDSSRNADVKEEIEDVWNDEEWDKDGNPRNKVALQPGRSLIDWIRLGTSGKDLTGLGSIAGTLSITKQELAKHNQKNDAWTAIRGRVYNITEYFSFHPGGEEELMKGAGVDATALFDQIHPWVNYEQILQKCLVGRLVAINPNIDTEALFFGEKRPSSLKSSNSSLEEPAGKPFGKTKLNFQNFLTFFIHPGVSAEKQQLLKPPSMPTALPRFDWIQKLDFITIIFYTKAFSNPLVEINPPFNDQTVLICLIYDGIVFKNELVFHEKIRWPCDVNVTIETGKVEFVFKKTSSGIWENYGVLTQRSKSANAALSAQVKTGYVLKRKMSVNHNTWLLQFERQDRKKTLIPIGKHVRVFGTVNGEEISRSYTPVPDNLLDKFVPSSTVGEGVCLMVKRYPEGRISRFITDQKSEDKVQFSKPLGAMDLKTIERRETFLLLAAGTGITPMLGLIMFLLERRIKKCQFLRLLFFNKTEADIPLKRQLEELEELDKRFKMDNVLSQAAESWRGHRGHINASLVQNSLQEHLKDTGYTIKDIFCFICGPPVFNQLAVEELDKLSIGESQIFVFDG
uniref:Cytochrome b5 reductase 4 n=1 Tax=Dendroctonus ponderosae TaxID=77166 RepID=A0AAR5QDZ7_DENPD